MSLPARIHSSLLIVLLLILPSCLVAVPPEISGLHVEGNAILNSSGQPLRLLGVNRHGTEYACIQGWGIFAGPSDAASIQAIASWGATALRVPLNESCWLNSATDPDPRHIYWGANYHQAIRDYVNLLNNNGLVAILDLHWTAGGTAEATGQEPLPNRAKSIEFWRQVATDYKDNSSVVFDLFNEPYPDNGGSSSSTWSCWREGGTCGGVSYAAAGMQELVDAVRATGAANIVMAGGLRWANDLSLWRTYRPSDPLNNLAAGWHVYNFNQCISESCWDAEVAPVAAIVPLIVGEMGPSENPDQSCTLQDTGFSCRLMNWLDDHNGSYNGHAWNLWNQCRDLIVSYDGTPTPVWGQEVKDRLQRRSCNLMANPEFDHGTTSWNLQLLNGAAATMDVQNPGGLSGANALGVALSNGGTADWHVQVQQTRGIVSGQSYQISFMARADATKTIRVVLQQNASPWTEYWRQTADVTTSAATFGPYTFNSTVTDAGALFKFYVGGNTTAVSLDKVVMTEPLPERDTVAPSAPSNLTASAVSSSAIDLQWSASTDNVAVEDYLVFRDGTQVATVAAASTTYRDSGLLASTTYSYTLRARDGDGNVSLPSNTSSATTAAPGPNLISNSEFDNGTTDWSLQLLNGAEGQMAVINPGGLSGANALKVTPTNGGTADWHIQIQQARGITSGKTYTISFMARADAAKTIRVALQKNASPWTEYWSQSVNVTTNAASYGPYTFNCTVTEPNTLFKFYVGGNTVVVYLDKVLMTE